MMFRNYVFEERSVKNEGITECKIIAHCLCNETMFSKAFKFTIIPDSVYF